MNHLNTEKEKDKLDLQPALQFVERHLEKYEAGFRHLISGTQARNPRLCNYAETAQLINTGPQLHPSDIATIVAHLPQSVQDLSTLRTVDYTSAGWIPVPLFEDGVWTGGAKMVYIDDFPRPGDHHSRILIGRSTGERIFPSALPASIHANVEVRWYYQLHVFLHEFFHTIELLRRGLDLRARILLSKKGSPFTFQKWWRDWEDEFAPAMKPRYATRYAATYADDLSWDVREKEPERFTRALAEQICESFVGYILGIAPNDEDEPDFKKHSPMAWSMIDDLATASVEQK